MPDPTPFCLCTTHPRHRSLTNIECDIKIERWTTVTDVLHHAARCLEAEFSNPLTLLGCVIYEPTRNVWLPFASLEQFYVGCQLLAIHSSMDLTNSGGEIVCPNPTTSFARMYRAVFERLKTDESFISDDFLRASETVLPPDGERCLSYDAFLVICRNFPNLVHTMHSEHVARTHVEEEVRLRRQVLDSAVTHTALERELLETRRGMLEDVGAILERRCTEVWSEEQRILAELRAQGPVIVTAERSMRELMGVRWT